MSADLIPNTLNTAIDRKYSRQLWDNLFLGTPLMNMMTEDFEEVDGGRVIVDEISYQTSPNAGVWGGGVNQLNSSFVGHMTEVTQNPCYYYWAVAIPDTYEILNSDGAQLINIVEAQLELAEMTLRNLLGNHIFGDGTTINGFSTIAGLKSIITFGTDPAGGAYGGVTRVGASGDFDTPVGNGFWNGNSVAINANGNVTRWKGTLAFGNTTTLTLAPMQAMYSFCTVNGVGPELMVGSMLTYNAYYNNLVQIVRQPTTDDLGKQGFTGLMFNNTPMIQDDACDTDSIYFINKRYTKWRPWARANFAITNWRQPADQLVNVKYGLLIVNMTCTRPNTMGRLTAITQ